MIFFNIGIYATSKAMIDKPIVAFEIIDDAIQLDTIQPPSRKIENKKRKRRKKSWLPKIRLRFLVILFREKLKEREKRKRKYVYPIVDSERKKSATVQTK